MGVYARRTAPYKPICVFEFFVVIIYIEILSEHRERNVSFYTNWMNETIFRQSRFILSLYTLDGIFLYDERPNIFNSYYSLRSAHKNGTISVMGWWPYTGKMCNVCASRRLCHVNAEQNKKYTLFYAHVWLELLKCCRRRAGSEFYFNIYIFFFCLWKHMGSFRVQKRHIAVYLDIALEIIGLTNKYMYWFLLKGRTNIWVGGEAK